MTPMENFDFEIEWQFAEPYRRVDLPDLPDTHPVRVFADYWMTRSEEDSPMPRSEFSPADIPQVIPWLMILERFGDSDYGYRLCGTGCVDLFGIDYTNCELGDHLPEESAETRRREFEEVWREAKPVYSHTRVPIPGREFLRIFRGVFPVSTREDQLDQVFVVIASAEPLGGQRDDIEPA
tara:strand:- start:61 stop:600 length:540 start_codon:yes stop_codon:yes gene_type:complete